MFWRRRRDNEVAAVVLYGRGREIEISEVNFAAGVIESIRAWLSGRMSTKECRRKVLKACVLAGAGIAGAAAGMAAGAVAGPAVGRIVANVTSGTLKTLLKKFFGFEKDEALDKAYSYFGIRMNATNDEIREVYRANCLRLHPDKGGDAEAFHLMHMHYAVIKAHKHL